MKKPNVTEGEWIADKYDVVTGDNDLVARSYRAIDSKEDRANAKAISAVPDMIDALIGLSNLAADAVRAHGHDPSKEEALIKAEKALEKAGVEI